MYVIFHAKFVLYIPWKKCRKQLLAWHFLIWCLCNEVNLFCKSHGKFRFSQDEVSFLIKMIEKVIKRTGIINSLLFLHVELSFRRRAKIQSFMFARAWSPNMTWRRTSPPTEHRQFLVYFNIQTRSNAIQLQCVLFAAKFYHISHLGVLNTTHLQKFFKVRCRSKHFQGLLALLVLEVLDSSLEEGLVSEART